MVSQFMVVCLILQDKEDINSILGQTLPENMFFVVTKIEADDEDESSSEEESDEDEDDDDEYEKEIEEKETKNKKTVGIELMKIMSVVSQSMDANH